MSGMIEMEECIECGAIKGVHRDCASPHCDNQRKEEMLDWDWYNEMVYAREKY